MLSDTIFNKFKIGIKFNLVLLLVFIIGSSLSGFALSQVLEQRAEAEMISKASALMEMVNSVRNYTQDRVNPLLEPKLETESAFIPEAIPTFSAREVFNKFRKIGEYKSFFYKDATLNPTNLIDKADSFETKLVEDFRRQPQLHEVSGFRSVSGNDSFYIARPFAITDQKCLKCHTTPAEAPKSLVAAYGTENGFGWKLHDIVASQIIYVPAEEVFASSRRSFYIVMGVVIAAFAIAILAINFLLRKTVIQRIKNMSKAAHKVSTGEMDSDFEKNSHDEIGVLAAAFNRMKTSLEVAVKLLNQQHTSY